MNQQRTTNLLSIVGVISLLLTVLLFSWILFLGWNRHYITKQLAKNLIINTYDSAKNYDGLFILMGNLEDRSEEAAKIYSLHRSLEIYMVDSESSFIKRNLEIIREVDLCKLYLTKFGVPSSKIHIFKTPVISPSRSTKTESENFLKLILSHQIQGKKFLLLTSWFHSARALKIFNKITQSNPTLEFDVHPTQPPDPLSKWVSEEKHFLAVFNEYLKWIHNFYLTPS